MARPPLDVESITRRIAPGARRSPVPGHEHQRGWGVLAFPFDSGHVLALRVARQNDFAPYTSVWHRTPDGAWSIYVDGPRLDTACPRYWGAATEHSQLTDIAVEWTTPRDLVVEMTDPALRWTASMRAGVLVGVLNSMTRRLPGPLLRARPAIRLVEWIGERLLHLGDVTLSTPVPNGQDATVVTRRLFPIVDGSARLDGEDLGGPADASDAPTFGEARLPARPLFTIGTGYLTIADEDEYERTVGDVRQRRSAADVRGPERSSAASEEEC